MATTQILPEEDRGLTWSFGHVGDSPPNPAHRDASTPQGFRIDFPCTAWQNPGLTMDVLIEASFDGEQTWSTFTAFSGQSGRLGKDGLVHSPAVNVSWDGQAIDLRGTVTVGPASYAWGMTITSV